jgi:hypothetical protein
VLRAVHMSSAAVRGDRKESEMKRRRRWTERGNLESDSGSEAAMSRMGGTRRAGDRRSKGWRFRRADRGGRREGRRGEGEAIPLASGVEVGYWHRNGSMPGKEGRPAWLRDRPLRRNTGGRGVWRRVRESDGDSRRRIRREGLAEVGTGEGPGWGGREGGTGRWSLVAAAQAGRA